MNNFFLFSTHFPSLDDMLLIISVGISVIYFFGEATDVKTVLFVNTLSKNSIPLEMVQLK